MSTQEVSWSADDRREHIKRDLQQSGFVSVKGLTRRFGVSDMTVRRDLRRLEEEGELRIVHGGASLPIGADYSQRGQSEPNAKATIGRFAASLLPRNATVLMDAGTTVAAVAQSLPDDFGGYVITHSVPVVEALLQRPGQHVHCLGGEVRSESRAMIGPTTVENLAKVNAQYLVLGAAAVNDHGVFVDKDIERGTKSALISASQRVILVVDRTKFTKLSPVVLAPLAVVDEIVTDANPPTAIADVCESLGITVHVVQP
ncbi:MAG: DeoR/GlpR family DNA-binding transcription regulator [Propionibacteriaceae bacterium]|nr:DeoR/GlpR family DNA-binding transcription regulator [Propionibacteriaceae bacterium]